MGLGLPEMANEKLRCARRARGRSEREFKGRVIITHQPRKVPKLSQNLPREIGGPALARALSRTIDAVATTAIVTNPREAFVEDAPTLLVSFARSGDSPESVAAFAG